MILFYFELLSITETLTLIFTALGLLISSVAVLITVKGLKLAYDAMKEWKKEKEWDILLEAKCNAKLALEYLKYIYSKDSIIWDYQNPKYKSEAEVVTPFGSDPISLNSKTLINEHPFTEEKIRTIHDKLNVVLSKNTNILLSYYTEVVNRIDDFDIYLKILDLQNEMFDSGEVNEMDYEEHAETYRTFVRKIILPNLNSLNIQLEEIKKYDINM